MTQPTGAHDRIAVAPISWGVCEVPGWGEQIPTDRVLTEMSSLGMTATELGPDGFLPADPDECAAVLADHRMRPVGGFVPVVLHREDTDFWPLVETKVDLLVRTGSRHLVLAAETGVAGYDAREELTADQWSRLLDRLDRIDDYAARHGMTASLHPHVGTMIETGADLDRVLAGSHVGICLDTGHLLLGGGDPLDVARSHPDRIRHVHLKDVRLAVAREFRAGTVDYRGAVRRGMYTALGTGDVPVAELVATLEGAGYQGLYVLEQDTILAEIPPPGTGPVDDVRRSIDFLSPAVVTV